MSKDRLSVIIHGGAGRFKRSRAIPKLPVMKSALDAAWELLNAGAPGEEAVAAALKEMEASEYFNAGYGGYPNANQIVLLDAAIMKGNREFISLMNARRVKFPGTYAVDMLRKGKSLVTVWTHEMMQELDSAPRELKERYGWVQTHEELLAPIVKEMIARDEAEFSADGATAALYRSEPGEVNGTVGCAVRDSSGQLHAGISTGGINHKVNGRIGDAPMIGLGVYADDELCAMTTTGNGEALLAGFPTGFIIGEIRRALARDPEIFTDSERALDEILAYEFKELSRKIQGRGGGIIIIPKGGQPNFAFNTDMIPVGIRAAEGVEVVRDEVFIALKDGTKVM